MNATQTRLLFSLIVAVAMLLLACTSANELNRQTALTLARGKIQKEVFAEMAPFSQGYDILRKGGPDEFRQLVEAKILSCEWGGENLRYVNCKPGPNSQDMSGGPLSALTLLLGSKVPTEVTGISKRDATTTVADVTLAFQPSAGYKIYEQYPGVWRLPNPQARETENSRVLFRLYDDGWRLEGIE